MKFSLSHLTGCFEGVVPSKIATCSKAGVPNASYLSHVYQIDEKHVATSYQFFNKTRANLLENPYASIQVRRPCNLQAYRLSVKYLRSEDQGPIFEKMAVKLDIIAASEGMGTLFKLKAADIYEVLEIEEMAKRPPPPSDCLQAQEENLELVRMVSEKLNLAQNMEEFLDLSLELLNRYLKWTHLILLLADHPQKTLLTHTSFGYPEGGVGSEVQWGQGLIGMCAQLGRTLQISALNEGLRYAQAVKKSLAQKVKETCIPLPGLQQPAAQIAVPIMIQNELQGVLFVESQQQTYWNHRDLMILSIVTNMLGMGLRSFEGKPDIIKNLPLRSPLSTESSKSWSFRYLEDEDIIFVNDQYLIKNIPARILRYLIDTYTTQGRTEFSNMELRSEKSLQLPDFKDNLETRLILLRKRLEEKESGLRLVNTGRGKFKIEVFGRISLNGSAYLA